MTFDDQWGNAAATLVTLVTTYGLRVIGAMAILIGGWTVSRLLHGLVVRLFLRAPHVDRTIALFLANGVRYLALGFTFVAVLTTFGVATTSFVAVLGAFGVAVGLALQGTLSNLAAGIMLVVFRPFHVGDRVETGGVAGTVQEINLFFTEIDADDNTRIIIPNGKLWGEIVRVPTHNDTARVEVRYAHPAGEDVGAASARLRALAERDGRVLQVAEVGVESLSESSFTLLARLWVKRREQSSVLFDLNRQVKEDFAGLAARASRAAAVERRAGAG